MKSRAGWRSGLSIEAESTDEAGRPLTWRATATYLGVAAETVVDHYVVTASYAGEVPAKEAEPATMEATATYEPKAEAEAPAPEAEAEAGGVPWQAAAGGGSQAGGGVSAAGLDTVADGAVTGSLARIEAAEVTTEDAERLLAEIGEACERGDATLSGEAGRAVVARAAASLAAAGADGDAVAAAAEAASARVADSAQVDLLP